MTRHILITGGTGFIGRPLCKALIERGDTVTVHSRQAADKVTQLCGDVTTINKFEEMRALGHIDAIVNLAGAGIAEKRWTQARKKQLLDSRVALTENLIKMLSTSFHQPEIMISGSAVGFYGAQGNEVVTEEATARIEFTHELCAAWERAAAKAGTLGTRVVFSRTGLVIGKNDGFMAKMLPPFKVGLGGRLGSGDQYMPWIHRDDMVRGLLFLLDTPATEGAYNLVAPKPVTNAEFTRSLGQTLGKPAFLPVPAIALKLGLGEMARLLLTGQRAIPQRLQQAGFSFRYPEVGPALADVLSRK